MLTEELFDGLSITCELVRMGKDYTLAIYGGERAHVGSVVLAFPRPSLTGEGLSATSSVLNAVGHKDEAVARQFAEEIAKAKNCTVACSCGIHIDGATPAQLLQIQESCMRLLNRVIEKINEEA